MPFEFDPGKDAANIAKHGLSLGDFDGFDAEPVISVDDRLDYGEVRYRAFGRVRGDGRCLVFTMRKGIMLLISYRAAREKELRRHE
jgi:uncharacterized DUF497 family protein